MKRLNVKNYEEIKNWIVNDDHFDVYAKPIATTQEEKQRTVALVNGGYIASFDTKEEAEAFAKPLREKKAFTDKAQVSQGAMALQITELNNIIGTHIKEVKYLDPLKGSRLEAEWAVIHAYITKANRLFLHGEKYLFPKNTLTLLNSITNSIPEYLSKEIESILKDADTLGELNKENLGNVLSILYPQNKYHAKLGFDPAKPNDVSKETLPEGGVPNYDVYKPKDIPKGNIPENFSFIKHDSEGSFIEIKDPNSKDYTRYYQHKVEGLFNGVFFSHTYKDTSQDPLATIAFVKGMFNDLNEHYMSKQDGLNLEQSLMSWTQTKLDALKTSEKELPDYSNLKVNGTLYNRVKNLKAFIYKGTIFHEPYIHGNSITFHSVSYKQGKIVGSMIKLIKGSQASIIVNSKETGGATQKDLEDLEHKLTTLIRQHIAGAKNWRVVIKSLPAGKTEWLSLTPQGANFSNIVSTSAMLTFDEKQTTLSGVFVDAIQGTDRAHYLMVHKDESREALNTDKQHFVEVRISDEGFMLATIQNGNSLSSQPEVLNLTISGVL